MLLPCFRYISSTTNKFNLKRDELERKIPGLVVVEMDSIPIISGITHERGL